MRLRSRIYEQEIKAARSRTLERLAKAANTAVFRERTNLIDAAADMDSCRQISIGADVLDRQLADALKFVPKYSASAPIAAGRSLCLSSFPIVNRRDLSIGMGAFISRHNSDNSVLRPNCYISSSSGSTGRPVTHIKSQSDEGFWEMVFRERLRRVLRLPLHKEQLDLGLRIKGQPLIEGQVLPGTTLSWNMRSFRKEVELQAEEYLTVIKQAEPHLIFGTPTKVSELAYVCSQKGIGLSINAILTSYEPLISKQRVSIERQFQIPVIEVYGTSELGSLAYRCRHGKFHYFPDIHYVEVLNSDGSKSGVGELGQLAVTAIRSRVMPLIRYVTGDIVRASEDKECPCGAGSSTFEDLEGRNTDNLITVSGVWFAPYGLVNLLGQLGLQEFQVVHSAPGHITICYANYDDFSTSNLSRVVKHLEVLTNEVFVIKHKSVLQFIETKNGKKNPFVRTF